MRAQALVTRKTPWVAAASRSRFVALQLLLLLLLSITALQSHAQQLPNLHAEEDAIKKQDESPYSARVRGYGSVTPDGAITTALRGVTGAAEAYHDLVSHFEDVLSHPNCLLRDIDWVKKLEGFATLRGWTKPPTGCVSSTRESRGKSKLSDSDVYHRLQRQGMAVDGVVREVERRTVRNFTTAIFPRSFTYEKRLQKCVVERATALRVLAKNSTPLWFVLTGITNANVTTDLADWKRVYVNEYVGVDAKGDFRDPLPQFVRPAGAGGESQPRKDFATTMEMWGGRVGLSGIYNMVVDSTPALVRALEKGDTDVNQATDALTPSNIAILALPMVLNIVPISFITDVGNFGILIYTLVTDMLTVVPFIIKGFELIAMGNRRQIVEETWFAGRKTDVFVVLETWAAECRIIRVHGKGVIFVIVGFVVLVFGILAEIQAKRMRDRWLRDGTLEAGTAEHFVALLQNRRVRGAIRKSDVHGRDELFDPFDEEAAFRAQQTSAANR